MAKPTARQPVTSPSTERWSNVAAHFALVDAARAFGRDCDGASVPLAVYRPRVKALLAAAHAFYASEKHE